MKTFKTMQELFNEAGFSVLNKNDALKGERAWAMYQQALANGNPGAYGLAAEVLSRRPGSRKATVSKQREADITVKIDGRLVKAERKTSGGRVNDIRTAFVVYSLSVHNSTGNKDITPRIMKTEAFMEALKECGALKVARHGGVPDGIAIQPSNRRLWAWLEEQLEYNREWEYYAEDFEG